MRWHTKPTIILMKCYVIPLLLALCPATAHAADAGKVAFFGITYLDTSLQSEAFGRDPAEVARIKLLEELVRQTFTEQGYDLLDLAPIQAELDTVVNPAKCYGCDARMATKLGADYALVGEVQKVSNLILSMNLQLRDAASGETMKGRVVDIRSNTDESWLRGMRYILKNAIFKDEMGGKP